MINIKDIQIGKTYYIVFVYDKGAYEVTEITPTKTYIDEVGRGRHIINVQYKEDKSKIYWINRNWSINEYNTEFEKPEVYIFDDIKCMMTCLDCCTNEKIKNIQKEITEKEKQIVEVCENHAAFITKYIDILY